MSTSTPETEYKIVTVCGVETCSCPAYKFSNPPKICKHVQVSQAEKIFGTKAIDSYSSTQEKAENDPELKNFLNQV